MTTSPLELFDQLEQDTIKEIGNIAMGSSATTLSQLTSHRVNITTPTLSYKTAEEINNCFTVPCVLVEVEYVEGIIGKNLLVIDQRDAVIIGQLMMMEEPNPEEEISEIHLSAVGEAMNQMMGSAATAMSDIFHRKINISAPKVRHIQVSQEEAETIVNEGMLQISFRIEVAGLIDSHLLQFVPVDFARQVVDYLLSGYREDSEQADLPAAGEEELPAAPREEERPVAEQPAAKSFTGEDIDFVSDIVLELQGVVGRVRMPLEKVLQLGIGSVVELDKEVGDDVEVLINGKPVAKAEIVAVGGQYGLRLTNIFK